MQTDKPLLFPDYINEQRKAIKTTAERILTMRTYLKDNDVPAMVDKNEVMANLTLTYRHLEDASMRLGKVLQANDGGVSVYDKDTTVGV